MRIISFRLFRDHCDSFGESYDFNKRCCEHGWHDHTETLTIDPGTKVRYKYHPCREKYCPVLQGCEEYKV